VKRKAAHAIKTARYTNATATVCNSTLDTLVLGKQEKLRYIGKEWNYRPIQTSQTDHAIFLDVHQSMAIGHKHGHRPSKHVIGTPQEALCVGLSLGGSIC
jgi:hypothetical protein